MLKVTLSEEWNKAFPHAFVGILALHGVANPSRAPTLEKRKSALEADLRARYANYDRTAFRSLPNMRPYVDYYRAFKKTYHVQLQLESIVLHAKPIPQVSALVEAMFMAELDNQLLTAGHDLDAVVEPVSIGVSDGTERYVRLNGREQVLKSGDMLIADQKGVLSSVIYGPDRRSQIRPTTRQALFTVYAPAGITVKSVRSHLEEIRDNVMLFAPEAKVSLLRTYGAD